MAKLTIAIPQPLAAQVRAHFGDLTPETIIAAVDYACRRKQALAKDSKRHKAGKLPRAFYAPRVDALDKAPRKVVQLVEALHATGERLAPTKGKA